ncbi:ubiquitin-protein transferase [Aureococcus anophagefferens]|nr:ubiquitin-protein transferase [Aureococcus anophagefferens]
MASADPWAALREWVALLPVVEDFGLDDALLDLLFEEAARVEDHNAKEGVTNKTKKTWDGLSKQLEDARKLEAKKKRASSSKVKAKAGEEEKKEEKATLGVKELTKLLKAGKPDARERFDRFQRSSAVLKNTGHRLRYFKEMRAAHAAKGYDVTQLELNRYMWHSMWMERNLEALGFGEDAPERPLMIQSEEAMQSPLKPTVLRESVVGDAAKFVVVELKLPAKFLEAVRAVECVAEMISGDGVLENVSAPLLVDDLANWAGETHLVGTATVPSLGAGGWDITWRVGVAKSTGEMSWSSPSAGAYVEVVGAKRRERELVALQHVDTCVKHTQHLERLLAEAEGWGGLADADLDRAAAQLERAITRCAGAANRAFGAPGASVLVGNARRAVDRAKPVHGRLEDRRAMRLKRKVRRDFANDARDRVWSGTFGSWIAAVTAEDLERSHGDANRLFQALVDVDWATDVELDLAAERGTSLFSRRDVDKLRDAAQAYRDKADEQRREREAAAAAAKRFDARAEAAAERRRREESERFDREMAFFKAQQEGGRLAAEETADDGFPAYDAAAFEGPPAPPAPVAPPPPAPAAPAYPAYAPEVSPEADVAGAGDDLYCPITHELFGDPVVLAGDGHTYERRAITEWFQRGNATSPLTSAPLEPSQRALVPNYSVRRLADEHRATTAAAAAAPPALRPAGALGAAAARRGAAAARAVVSPPSSPAGVAGDLARFLDALDLGRDARRTLEAQCVENEILDFDTAKLISAEDWRDCGVKVGTRKKILHAFASYNR